MLRRLSAFWAGPAALLKRSSNLPFAWVFPRRPEASSRVTEWLLLSVLLLSGFTSCARHETQVQRGNRAQILHRSIGPDIPDLDPHLATGASEYAVLSALFEGLVTEDPSDLHPEPGVAERWQISPDGLVYTFTLRPNARWSNGNEVTAQDFVNSFRRVLTASLAADNASVLYVLQNAEAYHKGRLQDFTQVGATAPDAHTLRLQLEHANASFLSMLTMMPFLPVHRATVERYGTFAQRGNAWTRPEHFVGNGPFVLSEWKPGQKIVVTKAASYWDAATVRLKEIDFYPTESRDGEERSFRAGQLHLTDALPPAKVDTYRHEHPELLRIDPYLGTEFYRINVARPFLNERRVRRALALAVDRESIVSKVLRGGQVPALAFTPPGTQGYTSSASVPFDFEGARTLLAEAGYPGGRGAPPIELVFNTSESHRAVAEAIQEMWRKELGLDVRLLNQEFKSTLAARRAGDFQVLRSVWIGDYVDPQSFLSIWTTSSGNNYTGWSDPTYDHLLFEAARTSEIAARNLLLQKAEALLLDDAPFIPIYHYTHVFLIQPSVKNWHPTLLDHHPYKYVYLDES